jgi:hypothetical protein
MGSLTERSHSSPVAIAEEGPVQNEVTLRQIVDGISALLAVTTPDGAVEILNRQVLDYWRASKLARGSQATHAAMNVRS